MRTTEESRHLDAVSRAFINASTCGTCGTLVTGAINLEALRVQGRPVAQGIKRYDFLSSGGGLSEAEARFLTVNREK